jgi:AcrR family transcriptional regulator
VATPESAARRGRILAAARERFIERGLGGTTTRDIASAADVPESSMFRHFASKDELFEQAIAAHLEEILRSARGGDVSALARPLTEADRLDALTGMHQHYLRVMEQALPLLGAAMFSELEAGRAIYRARVYPLLDDMARASVRAMDGWSNSGADPETMIFLAFGGYLLVALDGYFAGRPIDHAGVARRMAWLIQYGARGRPAEPIAAEPAHRQVIGVGEPVDEGPTGPTGPFAAPPEPRARRRRLRSDAIANRARLLDAAREQFFARGFGGATTREIATAAGTTESALFRHFGSKERLFEEAVGHRLQEIIAAGAGAVRSGLSEVGQDADRLRIMREQHLHYLRLIERTAPLLGAALFAERDVGKHFYRSIVWPFLDEMGDTTDRALRPWAGGGVDGHTLIAVAVGGYLLLSLDSYFRGHQLDHDALAGKIAWLLYYGVAGRA